MLEWVAEIETCARPIRRWFWRALTDSRWTAETAYNLVSRPEHFKGTVTQQQKLVDGTQRVGRMGYQSQP